MNEPFDRPAEPFGPVELVTSTKAGHVSPGQIVAAVVAVAGLAMAITGLVKVVASADRFDAYMTLGGGLLVAVISVVVLLRLRTSPARMVRIGQEGLMVSERNRVESWRWEEIRALTVSGGAVRQLVLEDHRADRVADQRPRADAFTRAMGVGSPAAVRIPLDGLDQDEFTILTAINRCTGGRLPGGSTAG